MIHPTDIQVKACLGILAGLYAIPGVLALFRKQVAALVLFAIVFALNTALVGFNWAVAGEPPLGNMYHVLTFLPMTFFPLYFFLRWRDNLGWLLPYFAFAAVIPLVGTVFMESGHNWKRVAVLQSPWFVPHVVSYMISYALMAVAFIVSVAALVRRADPLSGKAWVEGGAAGYGQRCLVDAHGSAPRLVWEEGEAAVYQLCRLSMPFMTFGLLVGAVWAEEAWGAYWSWDPKETWALITWTAYLMYFHALRSPEWRSKALWIQVLAFIVLIITFLVVNLLPKFGGGFHSYAS